MDMPSAGDTVVQERGLWGLRCPRPARPRCPAGWPRLRPRGQLSAQPRGTRQPWGRRPQPAEHSSPFFFLDFRGNIRSWPGPGQGTRKPPKAGGMEGSGCVCHPFSPPRVIRGLRGRRGGPRRLRATSVRERGGGRGRRHTQDSHLDRLSSAARSQEREVKVKRCGGAAGPFRPRRALRARPAALQDPRGPPRPHLALCLSSRADVP
jgi:hypothetical protein